MKKSRDQSIDILRGWAIVLMIVSHAIFFRYGLGSGFLNTILNFANTFCYITFLFTFGVGIYHSVVNSVWDRERKIKTGWRILQLLIFYYVVGTISLWSYYPTSNWNVHLLVSEAWRVITFRYYASFTEYIPTFVIFMVIFYTLRTWLAERLKAWFLDKKIVITLGLFFLIHACANWLSHSIQVVPIYLRPMIGSTTTFDFPIMQYFVVAIMGIWSASWTRKSVEKVNSKIAYAGYALLVCSLLIKSSFNYSHVFGWIPTWINSPLRWPPSFSFIVSGLSSTYLFWITSRVMITTTVFNPLTKFLLYMGQRAVGFLVYHLILLFIIKIMNIPMFDVIELLIFCILIPLSYITTEKGLALIKISRYNTPNEKAN